MEKEHKANYLQCILNNLDYKFVFTIPNSDFENYNVNRLIDNGIIYVICYKKHNCICGKLITLIDVGDQVFPNGVFAYHNLHFINDGFDCSPLVIKDILE